MVVTPAQAGVQEVLDSRIRGNDGVVQRRIEPRDDGWLHVETT